MGTAVYQLLCMYTFFLKGEGEVGQKCFMSQRCSNRVVLLDIVHHRKGAGILTRRIEERYQRFNKQLMWEDGKRRTNETKREMRGLRSDVGLFAKKKKNRRAMFGLCCRLSSDSASANAGCRNPLRATRYQASNSRTMAISTMSPLQQRRLRAACLRTESSGAIRVLLLLYQNTLQQSRRLLRKNEDQVSPTALTNVDGRFVP